MSGTATPDYYDILQISPHADQLVITKVYRLLAAYYHPDNNQTGDEEKFKQVLKSYEVLSDPAKRSRYNLEMFGASGKPGKLSQLNASKSPGPHTLERSTGKPGESETTIHDSESNLSEREVRKFILLTLYDVRRNSPGKPELPLLVLAELLGCTVPSLDFSTWYLKEKGLIKVNESADFCITVAGVDFVEKDLLELDNRKQVLSLPAARHGQSGTSN